MTRRSQFGLLCAFAGIVLAAQACGGGSMNAEMGVTPGGAQDNGLAHEQIDEGLVPRPDAFTVEGMLNEHDLPLEAPPCERELCIRAAYGIAPAFDSGRAAIFLQMGFASGLDPATFRRPPLNLAVVVDRSGSMEGEKMSATKQALSRLIDQLDGRDRLAIVMFDDRVDVLVESTPVENREAIRARLSDIWARGSTDMASGLRAGYAQVALHAGTEGVLDRVMVFTDAMTNTGDTDTETFIGLASENAELGIGLTVFGVGIDLNQELVLAVSRLRGGNYFFLRDAATIASVFDKDFDLLVTPVAYDLTFRLVPKPGFRVAQVYGYSSWQSGSSTVEITVPTLFLSRNHGAIVARIETASETWPLGKPPIAELALEYETPAGELVGEAITQAYSGDEALRDTTIFYSQRAVRKTVALVNAALGMRRACELFWQGDREAAGDMARQTMEMLLSEAQEIEDAELRAEAEEAQKLVSNIGTASVTNDREVYATGMDEDMACGGFMCCTASGSAATPSLLLLLAVGLVVGSRLRRR